MLAGRRGLTMGTGSRAETVGVANQSGASLSTTGVTAIVLLIATSKLALHLYAGHRYGYFVDELYYLACSRHLDWGYVDQPPLIAAMAWLVRHTLGPSLPALRFVSGLAGAAEVVLTAMIARELGGGRFAQALAAISVLVATGILAADSLFTMNAFEPLFWMACAYLLVRMMKTGNERLWLAFGAVAGMGLENKYSMMIFGAGIVLGLLLTRERWLLANRWLWIGGGIAFAVFFPNLWWNVRHHFPFVELQANIRHSGRDVSLGFFSFFGQEILTMLPLTLPVWLAGLCFFFFAEQGKAFRAFGWAWVFTAGVIATLNPRVYYLYPAFPLLFAGGSVMCEVWLAGRRLLWLRLAYPLLMVVGGALFAPLGAPLLQAETYIRYTRALHLRPPAIETHKLGPLPQLYADQFGWPEMTLTVARVYNGLPPEVRAKTAIFGQNYGQAGAIDFFGPKYGLPPAIGGHQSYFLWGPRNYTGESMIVLDDDQERLEQLFSTVRKAATVYHPYSMPYEHFDVFYCQRLKEPLKQLWPKVKRWN
ncbi:MAG TPA: glycosyltransferase family 39 protein [Candidatus Cybelea sp.]|nr:glycosyltransferase family 39 protein [Candidatus Cybelea sp.]